MNELLRLRHISKSFPGVKALDNISFDLRGGETHCLCGENGAGKSTLIKILSGAYPPDEGGEILFDGKKVVLTPHVAQAIGIQTVYQEHIVFESLSIVENIFAGAEIERGVFLNRREMKSRTVEALEYLKSPLHPETIMGDLSSGGQKIVEIAKGLIFKRRVIILDEPTASFSVAEIENLLEIIQAVKASGVAILYVSHHLDEVFRIADRVTVLRDGRFVSVCSRTDLTKEKLIKDMVGRDPAAFYKRERVPIGEVVFEARHIVGKGVKDVSFSVRRGEILGVAGMAGSGRSSLMSVLFGSAPLLHGEITVNGKAAKHANPASSIRNRMCFITEDRQRTGLFLPQSIAQNVISAGLVNARGFFIRPSHDVRIGDRYVRELNIKSRDSRARVMTLSGGNQQKVVLAKWFNTHGEIFIFDEPTRGIDVGAKQDIYRIMVDLLKQGKAIIMVSSDMPEIISMSDRVLVMKGGRVTAELGGNDVSEENILEHSIGGKAI